MLPVLRKKVPAICRCNFITFAFLNIALPDGPKNPDRTVQFYW